jgi:two-component system response regulator
MKYEPVILLVEDNPDDEELTRRAFKASKIATRLIVARDGAEAIDFLSAAGAFAGRGAEDDPCLVLLDLKLPKIGGLEVLQKMRANPRTRMTPVVVLTSSTEEQDVIRSYGLGANSYVRKPVDFAQFADAMRALGHYWLVLNQPRGEARTLPPGDASGAKHT